MIAVGIGCRRGSAAAEILALIREALDRLPNLSFRGAAGEPGTGELQPSALPAANRPSLFTVAEKRDEPGLAEAAAALGLPLFFLEREALALVADAARSRSRRVEDMFGLPGIAETAALAGAGPDAVLLVPRLASAAVTCAVAGPPNERSPT